MKRCKKITCWTDYPFVELGDVAGKTAPIRHVRVISFDNNKYARVSLIGTGGVDRWDVECFVKAGYLYSKPGRLGDVKQVSFRKLERMIRS